MGAAAKKHPGGKGEQGKVNFQGKHLLMFNSKPAGFVFAKTMGKFDCLSNGGKGARNLRGKIRSAPQPQDFSGSCFLRAQHLHATHSPKPKQSPMPLRPTVCSPQHTPVLKPLLPALPVHTGFNLLLLAIGAASGPTAHPSPSCLVTILPFLK